MDLQKIKLPMINKKITVATSSFKTQSQLTSRIEKEFREVVYLPSSCSNEALIHELKNSHGAIIGLSQINHELLVQCPELKVISKFGVGIDNIDFQACESHQTKVFYQKGTNRNAVAELALGGILFLLRQLEQNSQMGDTGAWQKIVGSELAGKSVGIVGLGNVGKRLCELLQPFHVTIYYNDIKIDHDFVEKHQLTFLEKEDLWKECDIISLHTPLTELTYQMIDENALKSMQDESILINTARGNLICFDALKKYCPVKRMKIHCDVFPEEPYFGAKELENSSTLFTPHIGASTKESILNMGQAAINGLIEGFQG